MRKLLLLCALLALARYCQDVEGAPAKAGAKPPSLALVLPNGLAVNQSGILFITDIATHRLLRVSPSGTLAVVAGTGDGGYSGDGLPAVKARLSAPHDVLAAPDGSLLIADTYNHRVRRIDRSGVISTVAGNGSGSYGGDSGPARQASLNNPQGLALDGQGNLYIADTYNHVVRRVDARGVISTFAGTEAGLAGDGGTAARAQLSMPSAVAVSPDGTVYISEAGNNRIRRVKPDGIIDTLLGTGPGSGTAGAGFGGDGGPVEKARIFAAMDLEITPSGDLLVCDSGNHRVRRISEGVITTVVGSGRGGFGGDGEEASAAALNTPQKLALGGDGTLFIADRANRRVRRVDTEGRITSLR